MTSLECGQEEPHISTAFGGGDDLELLLSTQHMQGNLSLLTDQHL